MNIVIVSNNYPSPQLPHKGAFVYNLAQELCKYHEVTVISPFKISDLIRKKKFYGEENCIVYRPIYPSFGNRKIGVLDLEQWSFLFKKWAVRKCFLKRSGTVDLVYAHFLINALTIDDIADKRKLPLVIASGESNYDGLSIFDKLRVQSLIKRTTSVISVSVHNANVLCRLGFPKDIIQILPNSVDYQLFMPLNKKKCKKKLGIDTNVFVVGFIGHFIHRKGPDRVIEAVNRLNDDRIKVICVGEGMPLGNKEFVKAIPPMANSSLPEIINAFDIFVLPTLSEGHCNVIEEVKACCVPIIGSKGTTVEEQLEPDSGILIDPLDVNEIAKAIKALQMDVRRREKMIQYLKKIRGKNSLSSRVTTINQLFLKIKNKNTYN